MATGNSAWNPWVWLVETSFETPAGNALAAGFRTADPQKLRDLLGDDFPICNAAALAKYDDCLKKPTP